MDFLALTSQPLPVSTSIKPSLEAVRSLVAFVVSGSIIMYSAAFISNSAIALVCIAFRL